MEFKQLRSYLDKLVNEYNTPSVDCIVYKNHKMLYRYFTGMSDIENKKKTTGKEQYIIYSMTKMITCTAALQLYEQGKFKLEDEVSKYLPEFGKMKITSDELNTENAAKVASGKSLGEALDTNESGYAKSPITVKDLFTMGAGLDYNIGSEDIKKALAEGRTSTRELVRAISETVLGFEPGTRFRYSLCHDVLGGLIEVWSGEKLGDYMYKNIFKPLGMERTYFYTSECKNNPDMAKLYTYDVNRKPALVETHCAYQISEEYQSGGAGLSSCTEDYALFLDALACGGIGSSGERILNPETVKLMGTNHLQGQQCEDFAELRKGYGYGLGVRVHTDKSKSDSQSPIGEFGWDGAAGAFSMVDCENEISLTYFQQIFGWDIALQSGLRNALYSDLAEEKALNRG